MALRVGPAAAAPPPGRQLCAREYLRPRGALSAACSEGSDGVALAVSEGVALVAMACAVVERRRAEMRRTNIEFRVQEEEGSGRKLSEKPNTLN